MPDPAIDDRRHVILVLLPNRPFFGASLMLVPALLHVRRHHPGARVVALTNHGMGALLERWGVVDAVWRHDRSGGAPFATFCRTLEQRLTLVVNCRPRSTRSHLWTMLMRTGKRKCFAHGLGGWIDAESRPWDTTRYKALTYLGLVGAGWHDHPGDLLADWPLIPSATSSGALVLVPCGGEDFKKWPLSHYLDLALRWRRSHVGAVQVLAGPGDPEVVEWLATPAVQEAGITQVEGDLAVEAAALRAAAVVVGNDCGPNHLAQLMDRPRVVLFPLNGGPGEWFRPGARAEYILPTSPLAELPVDVVWSAVQRVAG